MIYRNGVKEALQRSGVALGTFVQTASPESAEIAAACGFDYLILDMEHGSFAFESLVNLIRGVQVAGSTPIVRLPDGELRRETAALNVLYQEGERLRANVVNDRSHLGKHTESNSA
jgi:2-keto-3-deoxy-L-rhamnonate aldolase RhmA